VHALVTGAGGFLGQYIVEQLVARGDRVRAFSRRSYPALESLGVEQHQGDIQDAAAVRAACGGIDCVFHVAALAGIWGRWKDFYGVNTLGAINVVKACKKQAVRRLVFTSSPSVTFLGRDQRGVDESTGPFPRRWLAYYPFTKLLAEHAVLDADGDEGLSTCALRPHLIWGPRDQHLIPRLLQRARRGQLRQVGDGKNLIDATYVENAAAAHLLAADALALDSPLSGQAYYISNGEPVNCWDWINEILALAGLPPVQRRISFRAAYAAGAMFECLWTLLGRTDEPRMTRFLAAQLATSHYFDISAARRDFSYEPRVTMAQGMERLKSWLTEQAPGG
jgi:nucleoside-diphosphate-sugar epimerase